MKNIIGLIIILFGFSAPFLSKGLIESIWFYWIGFFLLLNPEKHITVSDRSLKWARKGLLANMIIFLILSIFFYLLPLNIKPVSLSVFLSDISQILGWVCRPASKIYDLLFPVPSVESPDGVVTYKLSFIRSITTTLFDILVYILAGVLVSKYISKDISKDNKAASPDAHTAARPVKQR